MPFADTHVHFYFPDFDADREAAIENARKAGIELFINIGTDVESSRQCLELAEKNPGFYASAGVHPHDANDASDEVISQIEQILKHPKMVAVGEVGLDYFHNHSPHEVQKEVLRRFIKIHHALKKPLVIHCRDAYEDMVQILTEEKATGGIMHCFSSDRAAMERFLALGFYISFAGPLTYKKNDVLREACKACPLDRLLLETDAPFLPPQTKRGKRNESSYMIETAEIAAQLHGLSLEELGERTYENARRAFNL